jgi:peroxiredoxin
MRALLIALSAVAVARADEPKTKPVRTPSPAEVAFADAVKAAQKALLEAKAYSVIADGRWALTGGKKEATGTNTVRMASAGPTRFRIDVGTAEEKDPHLVIACDGKTVTRFFADGKLYSVTPCDGTPLDDLQADGVTVPALRAAAVDFLARPNMLAVLSAQTLNVEELGTRTEGAKVRGFRLTLAGGQTVTVRFAAEGKPVPLEVSSVTVLPVGEKKTLTRTLTTTLKWDFDPKPADDALAFTPPADGKKVDDLAEAIFATDADEHLGKPLPAVEFAGLDGKPVKTADYTGKTAVVLYAWATWAAPSVADLPKINGFVEEYTKKGVTFIAVNAGDTPRAVREFAEKAKFGGVTALDPKGDGLAAIRMPSVPGVLVIDRGGVVRAYHRGKPDTADKVKADLDKLLK